MNSDITEQYLNKVYEDLHKEQMSLMTQMKNSNGDTEPKDKEKDLTKQISMINSLMLGVMRLRNLRKNVVLKANSS